MAKQQPRERPQVAGRRPVGVTQGVNSMGLATLIGVGAVLMISFSNYREIDRIEAGLGDRFKRVETQIAQVTAGIDQVSKKVDKVSVAAPKPARKGPDPNKVYTFNTKGAPYKGLSKAPITIVEFSDFQ